MEPVVCICIDENLINYVRPVYNSIMEYTKSIDFYIVCDKSVKKNSVKQYDDIATVITGINIPEINTNKLQGWNSIRSKAMYYRFLLPKLIKSDKIIYTEIDTIFQSDIKELWDIKLNNNLLAAVLDSHREKIQNFILNQYGQNIGVDVKLGINNILFASGLLVINAKKFREENIYEKMLTFYKKYPMLDLLLMNIVCNGRIKRIKDEWCVPVNTLQDGQCSITKIKYPKIKAFHWHGVKKPWRGQCNYQHIYNQYVYSFQKIYQVLYSNEGSVYGKVKHDRCPGVRLFPYYKNWLKGNIIDLGCGSGDTVKLLRKEGYTVDGMDFIHLKNDMIVGDITKRRNLKKYNTALCIDVFEHLCDKDVIKVLQNMNQTEKQIITVNTDNDSMNNYVNIDTFISLHINLKKFNEWYSFINKYVEIISSTKIHEKQRMYLCEKRNV